MDAARLCAYILAATTIVYALLYEDDPRNFDHQLAADFVAVPELLLVLKQSRNPVLYPATQCQAMKKARYSRNYWYRYAIYYLPPRTPTRLKYFVTTLTIAATPPHPRPNQLSYQTVLGGARFSFKLMYADKPNGCFILVINYGTFGRGCRLLRTASTVDQPLPQECETVYAHNCPIRSLEIYKPECRDLIPHNAW